MCFELTRMIKFCLVCRPPTDSGYVSNCTGRQVSEQSLLSEQAVDAMLRVRDRTDQLRSVAEYLEYFLYILNFYPNTIHILSYLT